LVILNKLKIDVHVTSVSDVFNRSFYFKNNFKMKKEKCKIN